MLMVHICFHQDHGNKICDLVKISKSKSKSSQNQYSRTVCNDLMMIKTYWFVNEDCKIKIHKKNQTKYLMISQNI